MRKFIKWLSSKKIVYDFCLNLIAYIAIHSENRLTPEYLKSKGWIQHGSYWIEKNIKSRDKVWIEFENHYYRVWHGSDKTFIALESSLEWFEVYYLFVSDRKKRYKIAGV